MLVLMALLSGAAMAGPNRPPPMSPTLPGEKWDVVPSQFQPLPLNPGVPAGLVLVLHDPQDALGGVSPWGRAIGDGRKQERPLLDDGESPDAKPGDRVYTALFDSLPTSELIVELVDGTGAALWFADSDAPTGITNPRADFILGEGRLQVQASWIAEAKEGEEGAPPAVGAQPSEPAGSGVAAPQAGPVGSPPPAAQAPSRLGTWFRYLALFEVGMVAGLLLQLLKGRSDRKVKVQPALTPAGHDTPPWGAGGLKVVGVKDAEARAAAALALARSHGPRRRVLFVHADPALAPEGSWVPERPLPSAQDLARALARLQASGPAALVVCGAQALEVPSDAEAPDQALEELVALVDPGWDVAVFTEPAPNNALPPSLELERVPGGLADASGRLLFREDGDGWSLAPA